MKFNKCSILIPCHSLEDFPIDLGADDAASVLNAWSVLWHPALIANTEKLPEWYSADHPPELPGGNLIVIPKPSEDWLPHDWIEQAETYGATIIRGISERSEYIAAVEKAIRHRAETEQAETEQAQSATADACPVIDPELLADFLAFGHCRLQIDLLARYMHYFDEVDDIRLLGDVFLAAKDATAGHVNNAQRHLKASYEILLEARERFYPVECYLIDLCLLNPDEKNLKGLQNSLSDLRSGKFEAPLNIMLTAADAKTISISNSERIAELKSAIAAGHCDLIGGDYQEKPCPLLPLNSALHELNRGHQVLKSLFDQTPVTWGRRRYGFATNLPQILTKFGYEAALHLILDDGLYPESEESKTNWEGADGTTINAITRLPLPADSSASYLRFAQTMGESMEQDHVAAMLFARWPELETPWYDDFRRIQHYAPVLGKFVTMREWADMTDDPGRHVKFEERQYLTPFLFQSVILNEADPISRYHRHYGNRSLYDLGCWFRSVTRLLRGEPPVQQAETRLECTLEASGPDRARTNTEAESTTESAPDLSSQITDFLQREARQLSHLILAKSDSQVGLLVFNTQTILQTVTVNLPAGQLPVAKPDATEPALKAMQVDDRQRCITLDIPACGFRWLPMQPESEVSSIADLTDRLMGRKQRGRSNKPLTPLVDDYLLRNEFVEVHLNEITGGIAKIKEYGRKPNRLSQQVGLRYATEKTYVDRETGQQVKTSYSEMVCQEMQILSTGPAVGEIKTAGILIDPQTQESISTFEQIVRLWRSRRIVEIELTLQPKLMPEADPWNNYYAMRFAWNASTASLTRSVLEGAHAAASSRIESPHYLEIADENERTTILSRGYPFHRKTGPRMLDSLLITAGETTRTFCFQIAIDAHYPLQSAQAALIPATVVPTETGPPQSGDTGWFVHLSEPNVQILQFENLIADLDHQERVFSTGFAIRLLETEGWHRSVQLRCFRKPTSARQRDFAGRSIAELSVDDGVVVIEIAPYEIADIELFF